VAVRVRRVGPILPAAWRPVPCLASAAASCRVPAPPRVVEQAFRSRPIRFHRAGR